ncbi:hypothetical protein KMB89_gp06 [Citrobacter phage HCF1]|uniref:Uncharacterized protein n=1 Tax=Citrobacter phage HCF1 TaxID=2849700 RepID=A0ABX6D8L8_9CAUD|nr:hypothetical protein KMB89_gp06 [Citrobacter phage HCF1]
MHKEGRRKYAAAPDDCIYTDFQPRKKMINAYEKLALRYWCNSRKKARAGAGYVDQCYFWKDHKEGRRKYAAAPDDCIYTDFQPRKKMINAYEKLALRYWCNSRKKARAGAGYVDQCYFWKDGKMSNELELLIADWYPDFEGSRRILMNSHTKI